MQVIKINIPKNDSKNIEPIVMNNLKQFVVLAGKNGAGKTRIVNEIKDCINSLLFGEERELVMSTMAENIAALDHTQKLAPQGPHVAKNTQNINTFKANIENFKNKLKHNSYVEVKHPLSGLKAFHYLPENLTFDCPRQMTPADLDKRSLMVDSPDSMVGISKCVFPRIQALQNRDANVRYHGYSGLLEEKDNAIEEYQKLQVIVRELLGSELGRDQDGTATIFDRPLGQSGLSDGQKVLLGLAVSLHAQGAKLDEAILILDEPENHLHPAALSEVFDRLATCVSKGQIWVATHSIPLLARFAPSDIWYVENGLITRGGPQMMNVLTSLIGNEDNISQIHSFLGLPAIYTMNKYSYECMFRPKAIMTGMEDSQSLQINDVITQLRVSGDKLKVFDYGAGIGRLPAFIAELHPDAMEWLDYRAFDEYPDDKCECEQNISKIYGSSEGRYFNTRDSFLSANPTWHSDVVIMTNVLHEIDPKKWLLVFNEQELLMTVLNDVGSLLVVEDQLIGKGEKAYKNGFLVLDTLHLQKLFETGNSTGFKVAKTSDDQRLKSHLIHKSLLRNINPTTRANTLMAVARTAKTEIQRLRDETPSFRNGKLLGFWLQQFATAHLEHDVHHC